MKRGLRECLQASTGRDAGQRKSKSSSGGKKVKEKIAGVKKNSNGQGWACREEGEKNKRFGGKRGLEETAFARGGETRMTQR